jgi:hypothetical protein
VAKTLDAFQLETLREILGVSKTCRKAGVRGELGEIPDRWRERIRQLLVARQMLRAPSGGLMEQIARQANSASPKLGVFRIVHSFLEATGGPLLEDFRSKGAIKRWIYTKALQEWKAKVDESSCLSRTYQLNTDLIIKGYLRKSYPGRIILTRLRLDDLDLGAASYRAKSEAQALCALCGEEEETREHFVLRCKTLAAARDGNSQAMDLTLGVPLARAFDLLTLATPRGADGDINKAILVGKFFHDLWTLRAKLLGLRHTLD